jgi:hypothetical protein
MVAGKALRTLFEMSRHGSPPVIRRRLVVLDLAGMERYGIGDAVNISLRWHVSDYRLGRTCW